MKKQLEQVVDELKRKRDLLKFSAEVCLNNKAYLRCAKIRGEIKSLCLCIKELEKILK